MNKTVGKVVYAPDYNREKITLNLPHDLLETAKQASKASGKKTLTSVIREALELYIKEQAKKKLREEYKIASTDPLFLSDVKETMEAFQNSDREQQ